MALLDYLTNVSCWILAGVVVGLAVGNLGDAAPYILMGFLMLMMCFSLEGVHFSKEDFKNQRKEVLAATACSFVVSPLVTLGIGLLYGPDMWPGWVVLACVPCAVSIISATFIMHGNVKLALLSTTVIYIIAVALTPVLISALIGSSVDPLLILRYVALFIAVPLVAAVPLRRLHLKQSIKSVVINICFFVLVAVSFGSCRSYILDEPLVVLAIAGGCAVRLAGVHFAVELGLRRCGVPRDDRIVYALQAIWKNSSFAMTLCLLLMPSLQAAAVPSAVSILLEMFYFMFMIWYYERKVPADGLDASI